MKIRKYSRKAQAGLSLIEVMIALTVGSVITAGVVQLFVANSETHRLMVGQSRMQESARFSLDFIGRNIRQAGYRGCFSSNEALYSTVDEDPATTDIYELPYAYDLVTGVQGYDTSINTQGTWNPALTALPQTSSGGTDTNVYSTGAGEGAGNGIDIDAILDGTDVLTIRNMDQQDIEARLDVLLGANDDIVVNVPPDGLDLLVDHFAIIHDCEKATIFRVTSIATDSPSAGLMTIGHDTADVDADRNRFNTLALKNSFSPDASVTAIESHTYFIAPGLGENAQGETPVSLWRKSGLAAPVELVEGVENLQILYGVSTNDNDTPNQYVTANFVTDWKQVTTIRVTVVVNSIDDVGGTSTPTQGCNVQTCITGETFDGLIRRSFTQTIKLRNSS